MAMGTAALAEAVGDGAERTARKVDLAKTTLRELNQALHGLKAGGGHLLAEPIRVVVREVHGHSFPPAGHLRPPGARASRGAGDW